MAWSARGRRFTRAGETTGGGRERRSRSAPRPQRTGGSEGAEGRSQELTVPRRQAQRAWGGRGDQPTPLLLTDNGARALAAELPVATETPRGIFFVLTVGWLVWPWGASPLHTAFL